MRRYILFIAVPLHLCVVSKSYIKYNGLEIRYNFSKYGSFHIEKEVRNIFHKHGLKNKCVECVWFPIDFVKGAYFFVKNIKNI